MSESNEATEHLISAYRSNPSTEYLLGALVGYRHSLALFKERYKENKENSLRLQQCSQKLDEAEAAITKKRMSKKVFLAWEMFHQVSEEFILFLTPLELAAEGERLALDLKLSSLPETVQTVWITKIKSDLEKLAQPNPADADIESARQSIKMALTTLNSQMDTLFWDLWTKKFSCLLYTLSLIASALVFLYLYSRPTGFRLCISNVMLIGSMGGVASGIMSADPQYIAKGHFWVSTIYYSLVRPAQGALAALVVFWMLQSQYLIKIDPPLDNASVAFSCNSSPETKSPTKDVGLAVFATFTSLKNRALLEKIAAAVSSESSKNSNTLIILNAAKGKEIFLYFVVLLMAGFSGDKILKSVSDKTLAKLYTEADKTKEVK